MRTLGLLGLTIVDNAFYEASADGDENEIDVQVKTVVVKGKQFPFKLSSIEEKLIACKKAVESYMTLGRNLWEQLKQQQFRKMNRQLDCSKNSGLANRDWHGR